MYRLYTDKNKQEKKDDSHSLTVSAEERTWKLLETALLDALLKIAKKKNHRVVTLLSEGKLGITVSILEGGWACFGIAFLAWEGYFLTCWHNLRDVSVSGIVGLFSLQKGKATLVPIKEIKHDQSRDLAIIIPQELEKYKKKNGFILSTSYHYAEDDGEAKFSVPTIEVEAKRKETSLSNELKIILIPKLKEAKIEKIQNEAVISDYTTKAQKVIFLNQCQFVIGDSGSPLLLESKNDQVIGIMEYSWFREKSKNSEEKALAIHSQEIDRFIKNDEEKKEEVKSPESTAPSSALPFSSLSAVSSSSSRSCSSSSSAAAASEEKKKGPS